MSNDTHQTETWVHQLPSPMLGIAILTCTVPRHGDGEPVRRTPHVSATQSACGRRQSRSQRPTATGAHTQRALQSCNAVRPNALHGDDSESFAVSLQADLRGCSSRIAHTATHPVAPRPCSSVCVCVCAHTAATAFQHEGGVIHSSAHSCSQG